MAINRVLLAVLISSLLIVPVSAVNFSTDQVLLKTLMKTGESSVKEIKVTNTDTQSGDFSVTFISPQNIIDITDSEFTLTSSQSKNIPVRFSTYNIDNGNLMPGVYIGKINVVSNGDNKIQRIPVITEVESQDVTYDTTLSVAPKYSSIPAGSDLSFDVNVINLRGKAGDSVIMTYSVLDLNSNSILPAQTETISLDSGTKFSKTIKLPSNLQKGTYVLAVTSEVDGITGTSTYIFESTGLIGQIGALEDFVNKHFFVLIIAIAIFSLIITIVAARRPANHVDNKYKKSKRK